MYLGRSSSTPLDLLKKLLALSTVLRWYSKRLPWNSLDPERVISSTIPPALRPYSALAPLVMMRNSETESVLLALGVRPKRGVTASLTSIPSSVLLLDPPRWPLIRAKLGSLG